jgi:HD-GYP domain-containing protein (c-di-GMP phosphodiesterase class II)
MTIRAKLLLLLLVLALVPMGLLSAYSLRTTHSMGMRLADESAQTLMDRERSYLEEKVADTARLLGKHFAFLRFEVEQQAREAERLLAAPVPEFGELVMAENIDAGQIPTVEHHLYRGEDRTGQPSFLPVAFDRVVSLFISNGSEELPSQSLEGDARRLNQMLGVYQRHYDVESVETLWHYTSLASGLHTSYPAHGGFPESFDPRNRPWYQAALDRDEAVWSLPTVDATTGKVVNTISKAVRNGDGEIVGVTAIDVSTPDIFRVVSAGPREWSDGAEAMILALEANGLGSQPAEIVVYAKASSGDGDEGSGWEDVPTRETVSDPSGELSEKLKFVRESGEVGFIRAPLRDEPALWSFARLGGEGSTGALIAIAVPMANVIAKSREAASFVESGVGAQRRALIIGLLAAAIGAGIVALLSAGTVTAPLEKLARTADGIAHGDYSSRVALNRSDEIGQLGQSIDQMAVNIDELLSEQERSCIQMLKSLTKALQSRDAYTAAHSGRVSRYSRMLGERIGLDPKTLDILGHGALVHDLGKIGVPGRVLNKPAPLEEDEFAIMKQHPKISAAIMKPLVRLKSYSEIAAWHHESWDGSGYPDGLAGEEIPLFARIVSIADTWDAMTGDRIYRKGMSTEVALGILEAEKDGGQWDPNLIRLFIDVIREEVKEDSIEA